MQSEITEDPEQPLRELVAAIIANDSAGVNRMLAASPQLPRASFRSGADRQHAKEFFLEAVGRYVVAGDTAMHIAAAAYRPEIARRLLAAGANVHARNRFGNEPLHAAAAGQPGSEKWNPGAQAATIDCLIEAGADPNAINKRSVRPLHIAVRTRCALAVLTLLRHGADPMSPNKNGSTPTVLARQNTGRGGSGSDAAKAEQKEILLLLEQRAKGPARL
jgi:ankyrin repeat protein